MSMQIDLTLLRSTVLLGIGCALLPAHLPGQQERPSTRVQLGSENRYRAVRLIEDRSTHQCWVLLKDLVYPAGPARLKPACNSDLAVPGSKKATAILRSSRPVPVIHPGQLLVVTQRTPQSELHLEATALGTAAVGEILRVQLKGAGWILPVIADAAGRAEIPQGGSEVRW
jgi:hypothetical protein